MGRPKGSKNRSGYTFRGHKDAVAKIQTGKVIQKLQRHVWGEEELSATQIRAAEILLRKTIPDLAAATVDLGADTLETLKDVSETERAARLAFFLEQRGLAAVRPDASGEHADMDAAPRPPDGSLLQ